MAFAMLTLAGMLSAGLPAQDPTPVELPDRARDALEKKWRDWEPAELRGSAASCLGATAAPVSILSADFDSDGHPDYALTVQTPDGLRLAAVLHRVREYAAFELDELGAEPPATIALAPRAARFTPPSGVDDFFPAETILVRRCGEPDVAYIWTGAGFRKTPLTGRTDPAPLER